MHIIDFHTHAFPDALAERAVPFLEQQGAIKAALDGKVSSLLRSMDACGIARSVVCSIATKPKQFQPIFDWSKEIASDRIIPLPSVHPADPEAADRVRLVAQAGFKGIKLHPYYQEFDMDEERVFPLYQAVADAHLLLVVHTGYDLAYPRDRKGDARKIVKVLDLFPTLRLVTTHLGAWEDWDDVFALLAGRPICMETSFSVKYLGAARARELMLRHPAEFLLFGSDSPWEGQAEALADLRALDLGEERLRGILGENARRLLGFS